MTSYAKLSLFSPAKINLFLHITGKRADGYHNLQTVFRLLDWGDTLEFLVTQDSFDPTAPINEQHLPVRLSSTVAITAQVMDNLVIKAAVALLQAWQNSALARSSDPAATPHLPVIEVTLNKVLPTGAGLGGGSSNAATTLIALNKLWGFHYDIEALIKIGATVGADVPIFVLGQDAIAEGIGERLTPIKLPQHQYLLLNPAAHAATQALFAHPDLQRNVPALSIDEIKAAQSCYLQQLNAPFSNVFEPVVTKVVPEVNQALNYLRQLEALTGTQARMTGTGSSVFLPIPTDKISLITHHLSNAGAPCDYVLTQSLDKNGQNPE